MNKEQSEPTPIDYDNVHSIQDAPSRKLRNHVELLKLNQEVKERQDQQARDALREHRRGRIKKLGLHAVRSENE